ncbi:FAD-dependent oxidoreductase [Croceicoccus sp. F390]|uniref:FAD-dependent oxidoreductase n=1 Tax=Croceicoccus esteveae TaxID=3075597 RepID=A0ABU2ZHB4_9SPHN|nr:FAD-dependent oxidoreductase [Croceicoccus sp. F390]MDT0575689.1 FAD-dependent oxidoreductase [Croceicoccus sp. F390]
MSNRFDVAIVGAGMAGASLAAAVGRRARVLLVEAEDQPGYHATGRSAAFWTPSYGGPGVVPLTLASHAALERGGFLRPRGALTLAREADRPLVEGFVATFAKLGIAVELVGRTRMVALVPQLRDDWTVAAWEPECCDIDVAALHGEYLKQARLSGVQLRSRARLHSAERTGGKWSLVLASGDPVEAGLLVNAAGAWADDIARLAGARPLRIQAMRRTMAQLVVAPPPPADLPLVLDINEKFYFKPENGRVWLSPHDETLSLPCDAAPEELDIATAVERLEQVVGWKVGRVERRWAGLRSFAPDRLPVYGFDAKVPGFFWFAGQGGFGIQTAPAAAALGAGLLLTEAVQGPACDIDPARYAPDRFD